MKTYGKRNRQRFDEKNEENIWKNKDDKNKGRTNVFGTRKEVRQEYVMNPILFILFNLYHSRYR